MSEKRKTESHRTLAVQDGNIATDHKVRQFIVQNNSSAELKFNAQGSDPATSYTFKIATGKMLVSPPGNYERITFHFASAPTSPDLAEVWLYSSPYQGAGWS